MEEEVVSQIEAHKIDEEELEEETGKFSIEQSLLDEYELIRKKYERIKFQYHEQKAKRAIYG